MAALWGAGARSVDELPGNGGFTVAINAAITGAIVGFRSGDYEPSPHTISHGFQIDGGRWRIVKAGEPVSSWTSFTGALDFTIRRLKGEVQYFTGTGGLVRTDADAPEGTVYLAASLAAAFDVIDSITRFQGPQETEAGVTGELPVPMLRAGSPKAQLKVPTPTLQAGEEAFTQFTVPTPTVRGSAIPSRADLEVSAPRLYAKVTRYGAALAAPAPEITAGSYEAFVAAETPAPSVAASTWNGFVRPTGVRALVPPPTMFSGKALVELSGADIKVPTPDALTADAYYTRAHVYAPVPQVLIHTVKVPSKPKFEVIIPSITHEVFEGTKVVERGFASNEAEVVVVGNLIDSVLAFDEFSVFRSDRWAENGRALDALQHNTVLLVESAADVLDAFADTSAQPGITEVAVGNDAVTLYSRAAFAFSDTAIANDAAIGVGYTAAVEDAQADNELQAITAQMVEVAAQFESAVEMVKLDDGTLIETTAVGYTDLEHWRLSVMLVGEFSEAFTEYLHRDPASIAWVLNPETAALSCYTNHPVTGMAGAFMIGPEGLMQIDDDSDNGEDIDALIDIPGLALEQPSQSGMTRTPERKRINAIWLDCEADTAMTLEVESYDQGMLRHQYQAIQAMDDTGNMKVDVGKGLKSKWWGMTIRNTNGGDFTLLGASADVLSTARRR